MNLTSKIFKIFTFIFIAQLAAVGSWAFFLYSSNDGQYPSSVLNGLTKVDRSIIEGIILQNKIGSPLARDLVAYKLLELNNVDSAEYLKPLSLPNLISSLDFQNCINHQDITICSKSNNKVALSLIPLKFGDHLEGYLKLEKSLKLVEEVNKKVLFTIGITVLVVFLINAFTLIMIWWKFLKPETTRLIRVFENEKEDPSILIEEYKKIQNSFLKAISRVKESESEKTLLVSQLQKINLATQVAHDIRSPLEVLKGLKDEMANLPDSSKKRIQLSINRIEEIAFNLLKTHKQSSEFEGDLKSEELLGILTSVVTEKNIEYRNSSGIEIVENFDSNSYGLFSKIQRNTLKNIVSNLVNNGIEALNGNSGKIEISLVSKNGSNVLSIKDNGPGISSAIASKLFTKGFTTKKTGNGLGLVNAKRDLEAIGGSLNFESKEGKGTTFTITLPKSNIPTSFIDAIHAYRYERIIILDDDPSFHDVWSKRLEGLESKVEHIYSVEEMFSKYQALHPKILLLSDFELMDKDLDGIDTILKLNHAQHSVLVTARNEELEIQERCLNAGIKLLPKSLVNYVMVRKTGMPMITGREGIGEGLDLAKDLSESSQAQLKSASMDENTGVYIIGKYSAENETRTTDAQNAQNQKTLIVLIDDDKLVRLNWSSYCETKRISFRDFSSIDGFLEVCDSIPKDAKIYIDSNLGHDIKGEVESEKIFNLGFKYLYLATGYGKEFIKKPSWIIEVYSKSPEIIG